MYDVISIGSATLDVFVMSDSFILTKDVFGVRPSTKNEISQGFFTCGGGATNTAVSFKRLGLKTGCLSLIGNDYINHYIKNSLKQEGVDRSLIVKDPKSTTDYSIILVAADGTRSVLVNRGKYDLQEKHIPWSKIKNTKWFYITSLSGNIDLLEKIIGYALENDIKIALNPGGRELAKRKQLIPLLQHVDFLLVNKEEAESLGPTVTACKTPIIAVTDGKNGAFVYCNEQIFYSPIINVQAVDETGAGDAFGSAFTAAIIYQKPIETALSWAINNSASVVSFLGTKPGLLSLKQITHAAQTDKN